MARAFSDVRATAASGSTARLLGNVPRAVLAVEDGKTARLATSRSQAPGARRRTTRRSSTRSCRRSSAREPGQRAALDDRPVAGKTGTTENYGDAWFVGYTPQLAVAVWVGYPDRLQPMLNEFDGEPVAGGTYPALIFKTFAKSALEARSTRSRPSRSRPVVPVRRADRGHLPGRRGGCATTATAATRTRSSSSPAPSRARRPTASRTRSRCRMWSARSSLDAQTRLADAAAGIAR